MGGFLRQATNSQSVAIGPFVDDTDFKTPETGLTIANTDIKLVVNGGSSANKNSGGGTHRVNGVYGITFDSTDTATVGELELSVYVSGALIVFDKFTVLEEDVYDALFAASAIGYLQPTTAGRKLDVSSGGEAGIDWANIGSPSTTQNLSGTTIKAVTDAVTITAAAIQAIWDALTSALTTSGSIGKLLVDNINATISSRLASASILLSSGKVTVGTNDDKTGYTLADGSLSSAKFAAGAIDAAALAQSAGQEIADEVLNRNIAGGGSGNTRNVRNALRTLRNRVNTQTGDLQVYEEDDTTLAWSGPLTRDAVDPIVEVNPS